MTAGAAQRSVEEVWRALEEQARSATAAGAGREPSGHCVALVSTHLSVADEDHPFFGRVRRGARMRAAQHGCDLLACASTRNQWLEEELVERCVTRGASGLVVLGGADGNPDVLSARWTGLPAVFVEYDTIGTRSGHVGVDNVSAFTDIVLHLLELGHHRVATVTGPMDTRVGAERLDAYRTSLQRIGYPVRPEYVVIGDFSAASGYEATRRLLALDEPPTAIAAACDAQAVGALRAIAAAGLRCPQDVAVTGFDDAPFAATMAPALTTVRQPGAEIGATAIDAIVAMIEDPALKPPVVELPCHLVIRESCH